jgi:hypothetical protein
MRSGLSDCFFAIDAQMEIDKLKKMIFVEIRFNQKNHFGF